RLWSSAVSRENCAKPDRLSRSIVSALFRNFFMLLLRADAPEALRWRSSRAPAASSRQDRLFSFHELQHAPQHLPHQLVQPLVLLARGRIGNGRYDLAARGRA